jgi:hypothetical protein
VTLRVREYDSGDSGVITGNGCTGCGGGLAEGGDECQDDDRHGA